MSHDVDPAVVHGKVLHYCREGRREIGARGAGCLNEGRGGRSAGGGMGEENGVPTL